MNCLQLRDVLVDHARGALTGIGSVAAVESHIEHCAICAAEHAKQRALSAGLRALAGASARARAPESLERRLLEAFAADQQLVPTVTRARARWGAAAASVLVAAGAGAWLGMATFGSPEIQRHPAASANSDAAAPPTTAAQPAASQEVRRPSDSGRRTGPPGRTPASTERRGFRPADHGSPPSAIDGFLPLPAAGGLPAFESGGIVRIDLPVSSLPAYGVELVPDPASTEVQADVLVGQDGQPRAIRLVPAANESRSRE